MYHILRGKGAEVVYIIIAIGVQQVFLGGVCSHMYKSCGHRQKLIVAITGSKWANSISHISRMLH